MKYKRSQIVLVEISCEEVRREVSNYLEDEVNLELRSRMQEHFRGCKHCAAVLDGTRNVVRLFGDATLLIYSPSSATDYIRSVGKLGRGQK